MCKPHVWAASVFQHLLLLFVQTSDPPCCLPPLAAKRATTTTRSALTFHTSANLIPLYEEKEEEASRVIYVTFGVQKEEEMGAAFGVCKHGASPSSFRFRVNHVFEQVTKGWLLACCVLPRSGHER